MMTKNKLFYTHPFTNSKGLGFIILFTPSNSSKKRQTTVFFFNRSPHYEQQHDDAERDSTKSFQQGVSSGEKITR